MITKQKLFNFQTYLASVTVAGLVLIALGLFTVQNIALPISFGVLLILAAFSEIATTTVRVGQTGLTFGVGTSVAIATIPVFGPGLAVLVVALTNIGAWLLKPKNDITWKRSWSQLGFNIGMHTISIFISGYLYVIIRSLLPSNELWAFLIPLFPASITYTYLNLAMVIGIIRLQNGPKIQAKEIWKDNTWAARIDILISAVGGCMLAYATINFEWPAILVFFLPIALSAYAFRLYVRQMNNHLDNLEKIVANRTEELAALNRQKDAFLAVLTHDMLTPLSSISLFTEIIQKDPDSIKSDPGLTKTIFHSQKTLMNLVNNVLDLDKLESGQPLPSRKQQVNLSQVLQDVISTVQIAATKKEICLTYEMPESNIWIMGDIQQLERIFLNLLSNGVKYTPRNGQVSVITKLDKFVVQVEIRDTGYGIPASDLPNIFDAYSRSDAHSDKQNGNGLGLAIAKALVTEHKGKIYAESIEENGTTFFISLPVSH
ncbi:MAG: sensor histidine kinase [Anaerolineae bacterium]